MLMLWIIAILILGVIVIIRIEIQNNRLLKTVTSLNRGTGTERDLVLTLLKSGVPKETIFHDLYLKKSNGKYCQVDVVVATSVGIIVFEVKRYSGWIFGTGYQKQWTQVLAFGLEKHRFYNPVIQNKTHIENLKRQLNQGNVPFFSVIVFYGDCRFKDISSIPDGIFLIKSDKIIEAVKTIKETNNPAMYRSKVEAVRVLREAAYNGGNISVQKQHVKNINDMLSKRRRFY
jgi:hypothetical protein